MLWALSQLVVSSDNGETWTRHRIETNWDRGSYPGMNRYASPEGKCSTLTVTADGSTWLKCDSSLMCRSTDFGVSWTGSTVGLQVLCYFQGPAISPHDPQQAMVAALDQGVFKTNDGGASWQPMRIQTNGGNDDWQNHDGSVVKAHPKLPKTWFPSSTATAARGIRVCIARMTPGRDVEARFGPRKSSSAANGASGSTTARWAICASIPRTPM